jgi:hypothetical protein
MSEAGVLLVRCPCNPAPWIGGSEKGGRRWAVHDWETESDGSGEEGKCQDEDAGEINGKGKRETEESAEAKVGTNLS